MMPPEKMAEMAEAMAAAAVEAVRAQETARQIIDMLGQHLADTANIDTGTATTSFRANQIGPGIAEAIKVIRVKYKVD